ncbi:MAG: hypothetical protein A3J74_08180 [Elusimicrobia bacterium RIFCSPHIGHO2_02_FULL_57_9]|nr:MAG: hypothetical protein A3J74_08180 [Elusimicrobia bacterium RIFCSPHIGHO2_02_FULL_57_9]
MTRQKLVFGSILVSAFILGPARSAAAPAAMSRPEQSGELKDILIEGVSRLSIKGDKPAYAPQLNPLPDVQNYLAQQINTAASAPKLLVNLPNYLPSRLTSDIVLSPWHGQLTRQPVLDIIIKHPKDITVASWRLVITDDQGKIFQTIRGKGRFPDRLTWNGKSSNGDMVKVGLPYAYSYFVLDRAEVPTYLPGKTILIKGLVNEYMTRSEITLDTKSLFDGGIKFSPAGLAALRETQDILRKTPKRAIKIDIYGPEPELAQKQADIIRRHLLNSLHMQEDRIAAKGSPLDRDRYARADIQSR